MTSESQIEELIRDVQYIKDRMAILDCIQRHARGQDRHDSDLLTSTYHRDGFDEHGPVLNPGPTYADWANQIHETAFNLHTHNITTHNCEIDGNVAHCESYVIACLLSPDKKTALIAAGRYVDRLEKRDGEWRILIRRTINDLAIQGDASCLQSEGMKDYPMGTWAKDDLSYQRPLTLEQPTARW